MNIYIICPVRNGTPDEITEYVESLEREGHSVHFPPRDVDQDDPTGARICREHRDYMKIADRVDVFWDVMSSGSHFDLGMAYGLGVPINLVKAYQPDREGKSYQKAVMTEDES